MYLDGFSYIRTVSTLSSNAQKCSATSLIIWIYCQCVAKNILIFAYRYHVTSFRFHCLFPTVYYAIHATRIDVFTKFDFIHLMVF